MQKKKRLLKIVSIFATLVFALFLSAPKAHAMYQDDLNVMLQGQGDFIIDPRGEQPLVIKIQYQYQVKDVQVYICKATASTPSACAGSENISTFKDLENYENPSGKMKMSDINGGGQETRTYVFAPSAPIKGTPIRDYVDGDYKVVVRASFCNMRNNAATACDSDENWTNVNGDYNLLCERVITLNGSFTGNSDVNNVIYRVLEIVNNYVIPVLWILLGVLLVVRGVILAIGIVKASDEAEVRASKIKGLVWLGIGVFAGYAITIGASVVMSLLGYGGIFK